MCPVLFVLFNHQIKPYIYSSFPSTKVEPKYYTVFQIEKKKKANKLNVTQQENETSL